MIRFAGMFLVLALSAMNAETYWLQIYQPVYLGGKELKTGEYKKLLPLRRESNPV